MSTNLILARTRWCHGMYVHTYIILLWIHSFPLSSSLANTEYFFVFKTFFPMNERDGGTTTRMPIWYDRIKLFRGLMHAPHAAAWEPTSRPSRGCQVRERLLLSSVATASSEIFLCRRHFWQLILSASPKIWRKGIFSLLYTSKVCRRCWPKQARSKNRLLSWSRRRKSDFK